MNSGSKCNCDILANLHECCQIVFFINSMLNLHFVQSSSELDSKRVCHEVANNFAAKFNAIFGCAQFAAELGFAEMKT